MSSTQDIRRDERIRLAEDIGDVIYLQWMWNNADDRMREMWLEMADRLLARGWRKDDAE